LQNFNPTLDFTVPADASSGNMGGLCADNNAAFTSYLNPPPSTNGTYCPGTSSVSPPDPAAVKHDPDTVKQENANPWTPQTQEQAQLIIYQLEECFNDRNLVAQPSSSSSAYNSGVPSPWFCTELQPGDGAGDVAADQHGPGGSNWHPPGTRAFTSNQTSSGPGPVLLTSLSEDMLNYPGDYDFNVLVGDSVESQSKVSILRKRYVRFFFCVGSKPNQRHRL
jgi:hypothetical protein